MKLKIKDVALFVILPILLMSIMLSVIGTSDSFAVHNYPKHISSPQEYSCVENSYNEFACQNMNGDLN